MRKVVLALILLTLVLAGAVGGWWLKAGRPAPEKIVEAVQTDAVRAWAAGQLSSIASDLLNPVYSMESAEYEYPRTLIAHGVRLRQGDVDIISVATARIELAKIPKEGEPIVFESIHLETPVVRLIPVSGAGLLGLSDLIKTGEGTVRDDGGSTVPSDVFALRRLEIVDGTVTLEPPDTEPMVLDDIDIATDVAPSASSPGLYELTGTLLREPIVKITAHAELEIDEGWLRLVNAEGTADLEEAQYQYLPPSLQQFVRKHQIEAHLVTSWRGMIPFTNDQVDLDWTLGLTDASAVIGDWHLPVESLDIVARMTRDAHELSSFRGRMLGGKVDMNGRFERRAPMQATLSVDADGLRLEEILHKAGSHEPRYRGAVSFEMDVASSLLDFPATLEGGGPASITDARLIDDPILSHLFSVVQLRPPGGDETDHASAQVTFDGDRVDAGELDVVTATMAVRGGGSIWHDGRLDFLVNAGPFERIQHGLGAVGDVFGAVTDRLVKYQITGTTEDPEIRVLPLGVGATPTDR